MNGRAQANPSQQLAWQARLAQLHNAFQRKDYVGAELMAEELLTQRKNDPVLLNILAKIASVRERYDQAIKYYERCIALRPRELGFQVDLGMLLTQMGRNTEAIKRLEKARRLAPGHPGVLGFLAGALERADRKAESRSLLAEFIEKKAETTQMAIVWARMALDDKHAEEAITVLERHRVDPGLMPAYWFLLGDAYDKAGDYEKAFNAYMGAKLGPTLPFDLDEFVQLHRDLMAVCRRDSIKKMPRPTHDTSRPIFIAGRPRSGTTLIEKILDAHPMITGIGEIPHFAVLMNTISVEIDSIKAYPHCLRDMDQSDVNRLSQGYLDAASSLAPDGPHVADKNLGNILWLGVFAILFPQCKAIHVIRDAVDNCWACFTNRLTYGWANSLRFTGITFRLYERLMRHWHEELDIPILDVEYEALVGDQEAGTRRILDHLGVPWDDACLNFHEKAGKGPEGVSMPTLSYNQVKKPIYTSSVKRSARFEPFLGELFGGLEEGKKIADSL